MTNFHRYYIKVYIYKIIHSANIDIFAEFNLQMQQNSD